MRLFVIISIFSCLFAWNLPIFICSVQCEGFKKQGNHRFSDEQMEWFCDQQNDSKSSSSDKPDIKLTDYQKAYLDFTRRCKSEDCLNFKFPSDQEVVRTGRSTASLLSPRIDWRCSHPETHWRPKFCKEKVVTKKNDLMLNDILKSRLKLTSSSFPRRLKRQTVPKAIRKEYRMLTDRERHKLHAAMNELKREQVDSMSKWDLLTFNHDPANAPGAHWGPAFLPWHRELLRQVEVALRNIDSEVALPYWDTTLDWDLPDPKDSVLWTAEFFGNGDGHVTTGPFAGWKTFTPLGKDPSVKTLYRTVGNDSRGGLYSPKDVDWILSRPTYSQLTFCDDKTFEMLHGLVHLYVGGFMEPIRTSPNDPVFYLLHTFVDWFWENFRQRHQTPWQRENDWTTLAKQCKPEHGFYAPMIPFNQTENRDGMSNKYTERWYRYLDRPECYQQAGSLSWMCGSPYLFCDRKQRRCRSKIRPGGNCTGLENTDACYESSCARGICVPSTRTAVIRQRPPLETKEKFIPAKPTQAEMKQKSRARIILDELPRLSKGPYPIAYMKVLLFGKGRQLIKGKDYFVHLRGVNYEASSSVAPIENATYPEHRGLAYVPIRRPTAKDKVVGVRITAFNPKSDPCVPYCFDRVKDEFRGCDGFLTLSQDPKISHPVAFSHSQQAKVYLNVDLTGHPGFWSVNPPYLNFLCDGERDPKKILHTLQSLRPNFSESEKVWFPIQVVDKQSPFQHPLSQGAQVIVRDKKNKKQTVRKNIAEHHSGPVFLQARNPLFSRRPVSLKLSVRTEKNKKCTAGCAKDDERRSSCSNELKLSLDSAVSFPIPFTTEESARDFLGWNMSGHSKDWTHRITPLTFYC